VQEDAHYNYCSAEKFMAQLERLHSEHQLELEDMERRHECTIAQLRAQLEAATAARKNASTSNDVTIHDNCLKQQRQLEKEFNTQLEENNLRVLDLAATNEQLRSKLESMEREVSVLRKTIVER